MVKKILAVTAGVLIGGLVIFLMETLGHEIFPPPAYLDPQKPETFARYMSEAPLGAILFVPLGWAAGSFTAGITATLLCNDGKRIYALSAGIILLMAGMMNLLMMPHPVWFWFIAVFLFLPPAWLGFMAVGKKSTR